MITKLCASLKPCHRLTCACYEKLKPLRKHPTLDMWLVMNGEYKEYKVCYNFKSEQPFQNYHRQCQ